MAELRKLNQAPSAYYMTSRCSDSYLRMCMMLFGYRRICSKKNEMAMDCLDAPMIFFTLILLRPAKSKPL